MADLKKCDHTSVGMLIFKGDKLLLIERKRKPFGFAPPAGHVDGDDSFEVAVKRELVEEVGLSAKNMELVAEGRRENHCRREDGTWHYWKIYKVEVDGEIKRSEDETKQAKFFTKNSINKLTKKTEEYIKGKISNQDWEKSPGVEPVWYEWLKQLKII